MKNVRSARRTLGLEFGAPSSQRKYSPPRLDELVVTAHPCARRHAPVVTARHTVDYYDRIAVLCDSLVDDDVYFLLGLVEEWGEPMLDSTIRAMEFVELSNGGFYFAPRWATAFDIVMAGKPVFQGLSGDVAGMMVTLVVLSDYQSILLQSGAKDRAGWQIAERVVDLLSFAVWDGAGGAMFKQLDGQLYRLPDVQLTKLCNTLPPGFSWRTK